MRCSCCGEQRDQAALASLPCHDEIKVCRSCIGWLRGSTGGLVSTPTLPVVDMAEAISFYQAARFDVRRYEDGGFAFVTHDGDSVFDLDLIDGLDPTANAAGCYIIAPDVDAWHARLSALGADVSAVEDMPWGMREFRLIDPSGNRLRFGRSIG